MTPNSYLGPARRLLDLFCKAGGCTKGYQRAGFECVGVDIQPQPNYCGKAFCHADAIALMDRLLAGGSFVASDGKTYGLSDFDAIHASPPCQKHSRCRGLSQARNGGQYGEHPDLIEPTRRRLAESGLPWVIENVVGAPLIDPVTLCGSMFEGLKVYRHRIFEASFRIVPPPHAPHRDQTPSAGNGISPKGFISVCGSGGVRGMNSTEILAYWSMAMGIDWMTRAELAEAVPPAFTHLIGRQLMGETRRAGTKSGVLSALSEAIENSDAGEVCRDDATLRLRHAAVATLDLFSESRPQSGEKRAER